MDTDEIKHYRKTWEEIEQWYESMKPYSKGYASMLQFVRETKKLKGIDRLATFGMLGTIVVQKPNDYNGDFESISVVGSNSGGKVLIRCRSSNELIVQEYDPFSASIEFNNFLEKLNWLEIDK